jgi:hypothetical protein
MKRFVVLAAAALAAAAACKDSTPPLVATTLRLSTDTVVFDAIGATRTITWSVLDQHGGAMIGAPVTWTSSSPAVTVAFDSAGAALDAMREIVTAKASGTAIVTATSGAAKATIVVTVAQRAVTVLKTGGDAQTGTVGGVLAAPLRVVAEDRLGVPVPNQTVRFTVSQGAGVVANATAVTAFDGSASTKWTLGTVALAPQELTATVDTMTARFSATATADSPQNVSVLRGGGQSAEAGALLPVAPAVRVTDGYGNPVPDCVVTFIVMAGDGTVTGALQRTNSDGIASVGGWTLGLSAGTNTLAASVLGSSVVPATFTAMAVAPPPTSGTVVLNAGDSQTGMASAPVPIAPSVVVRSSTGAPVVGASVTFAVTSGGGSVSGGTTKTNASGVATVGAWVLGATGGPNTMTASVSGGGVTGGPITFSAVGCTRPGNGYAISVCYVTPMSVSQRAAFDAAAARWSRVITSHAPDIPMDVRANVCDGNTPNLRMTVRDLMIFAAVDDIDGPGKVLGMAGWCFRRSNGVPVLGSMHFDVADMASLESRGLLGDVILHEMGHVLGVGTMWEDLGLLINPSTAGATPLDTYLNAPNATLGFNAIGGTAYTAGLKVPVENKYGAGTIDAHWRESVLANELMTGFISVGSNPLSEVTVRSLADMGYTVDVTQADPFFLNLSASAGVSGNRVPLPSISLGDDVLRLVRREVDRTGRTVRIPK